MNRSIANLIKSSNVIRKNTSFTCKLLDQLVQDPLSSLSSAYSIGGFFTVNRRPGETLRGSDLIMGRLFMGPAIFY